MQISYITFDSIPIWDESYDQGLNLHEGPPPLDMLKEAVLMQGSLNAEPAMEDYIMEMRHSSETCLTPVFFLSEPTSPRLKELMDGVVSDLGMLRLRAMMMHELRKKLSTSTVQMGPEFTLLAMLYVFGKALRPVEDACSPVQYRYPMAEAVLPQGEDSMRFVLRLQERGLIEPEFLLDRVRHCSNCWSTQLNYTDICENCGSLKLLRTTFLHCFNCGFVEREAEFMKDGRLGCPSCRTRLRDLGRDYDKTLESYICEDCKTRQVEPRVIARCLRCGQRNDPEDLLPQDIVTFRVTARAELVIFMGNVDALLMSLDVLDFVPFEVFKGLLDWQLRLYRRYPDAPFAVVALRIATLEEQTQRLGAERVSKLLDRFSKTLRELLRTTDLVSRSDKTTIWLLLPRMTSRGSNIVMSRIREMESMLELEDGSRFQFYSNLWFPEKVENAPADAAELFTGLLEGFGE